MSVFVKKIDGEIVIIFLSPQDQEVWPGLEELDENDAEVQRFFEEKGVSGSKIK